MGISTLQKASLYVAGVNSFTGVIFLSLGREKMIVQEPCLKGPAEETGEAKSPRTFLKPASDSPFYTKGICFTNLAETVYSSLCTGSGPKKKPCYKLRGCNQGVSEQNKRSCIQTFFKNGCV